MKVNFIVVFLVLSVFLVSLAGCSSDKKEGFAGVEKNAPDENEKIKLVYAVHWMENHQIKGIYENGVLKSKGLKQYLDEYSALNPNIEFEIIQIPYGEYAQKLMLSHETDSVPDIYQIYSTWGVSLANAKVLDSPPEELVEDIKNNYVSTAGVTINKRIWGIPTEINTYSLIYNKDILKEAGIVDEKGNAKPPRTWSELVDAAVKTTKRNEDGTISRYGVAFLKGSDWQVVDPFLVLLFSNNGKYLNDDNSEAIFNSPEGIAALKAELELFDKRATDVNANTWDFKDGKVAMIVTAPWTKATIKQGFGDKFEESVGTAPFPYIQKPATLQYSWFMGVMAKSNHKNEAWKFLKWFTSEVQPETGTTRYGDLLANTIGAIPSRKIDIQNHEAVLNDPFTKTYVDQLSISTPEPNVLNSAEIKNILMREIENSWSGSKNAEQALYDAALQINTILKDNIKQTTK